MVWRVRIFPDLGEWVRCVVFKKVSDDPERWTTTIEHEDFTESTTVEEFLKKNPSLTDLDWWEPEGAVDV